jgi:hypothetical protein
MRPELVGPLRSFTVTLGLHGVIAPAAASLGRTLALWWFAVVGLQAEGGGPEPVVA